MQTLSEDIHGQLLTYFINKPSSLSLPCNLICNQTTLDKIQSYSSIKELAEALNYKDPIITSIFPYVDTVIIEDTLPDNQFDFVN